MPLPTTKAPAPSLPDLRFPSGVPAPARPAALARFLCLAWLVLLAGCATTPGGKEAPDDTGAGGPPLLPAKQAPNYSFDIDAPRAFQDEIRRQTLVGRWQRREDYDPIQFDGLVARLQAEVVAILQSQGHFRAQVGVTSSPGKVAVKVEPGPQTTVASAVLRITGPAATDAQTMTQVPGIPGLERGRPFLAPAWQSAKREIVNTLNRRGYLRADIAASDARVDVAAGTAALELEIASGPRVAFGDLVVEGLTRYDRRIVEDLRTFTPGDPYSDDQLQEFQTRLRSSGYFSSVAALPDLLGLQEDPARDSVRIQVTLTELPRRRVALGLGYSTDEGPRGQVGFEHRDLFNTNLQLESALVLSAKRQRAFANFRTPYDENNNYIGFGQRVEREDIENLVSLRSNTYAGIGKREGDIDSFTSLQYQVERERIPAGAAGPEERNSQQALVLGKSWNLRRVDSTLDPREGYAISAQLSGARGGILTDRSFVRFQTRATRFQPLPNNTVFEDGTLIGLVEVGVVGASSREDIPSENLFRTGGVQSIRGYAYQSLGVQRGDAVVGGRYLALASLEYQHRITPSYAAAAFVDYGNAGDSRGDFDPVAGYGIGLRWRTPIGPVNLDLAYGQAVSRYRVHFSIGYTF